MMNPPTMNLKNVVAAWSESTKPPLARHLLHHHNQSMKEPSPNQKKKCNQGYQGDQSYKTARQPSQRSKKKGNHGQPPTSRETASSTIK
jgi:hypothetical protein